MLHSHYRSRHMRVTKNGIGLLGLMMAALLVCVSLPTWSLGARAATTPTSFGLAMQGITAYDEGWVYVYGGKGGMVGGVRGTDCAGLLYSYYSDCGVSGCAGGATSQVRQNTVFSGPVSLGLPRIHGLALTNSEPGGYSHIGIYIGNNESCDNSMEGVNMVRASVQERHWDGWHVFDIGTMYPKDGWYEFDGRMVHYTNYEYDVDTEIDGYFIGSDGFAYLEDGTAAPIDNELLSNVWVSATEVAGYLESQGWTGSDDPNDIPFDYNATVNASNVNLRSEPSTSSSVMGLLSKGTKLQAGSPVEGEPVTAHGSSYLMWYPVTTVTGLEGYVSEAYVELHLSAPEITSDGETVTMTAAGSSDDIYYTVDYTDPGLDENGDLTISTTPYVSPVAQVSCTYKAAVIKNGLMGPVTTATVMSNGMIFTDFTYKAWFADKVDRAVEMGILNGIGNGKFDPYGYITRAQFVIVLANLSGEDLSSYSFGEDIPGFSDVSNSAYYAKHLAWAVANGVVSSGDKFDPNQELPREQMCSMMDRYLTNVLGVTDIDVSQVDKFSDDKKISGYAKEAVYRMRALGIVSGNGNNSFDPKGTSERCAASVVAVLFHDKAIVPNT